MATNRRWKRLVGLLFVFLIWGASAVLAAVPAEINYQGRLEDMTGPVNGTFTLMFRLFDGQSGGTPMWEEAQSVAVDQGIYNVILGTGTLNPLYGTLEDVVLGNDDLWFEVQVFGESDAMSPRQKLTSVGFALRAGSVSDGAITTTMLATDAVTTEKLVDGAVTATKVTGGFVPDLDADKLDGYDSAEFATSVHNHDGQYYSKTYVDALEDRIAALEAKLQHLAVVAGTVNGMPGPHVIISGANLHVRSGSGSTYGTLNGTGNLVVGYNELRGSGDNRSGSHNIVVGLEQNYTSYGGLVTGYQNTISGTLATISGGSENIATGYAASVSGGTGNTAGHTHASVSGGSGNTAGAASSSVSGGTGNSATGSGSSISGGYGNTTSGGYASISGGRYNIASGNFSFVGGGGDSSPTFGNEAFSHYSAILGGYNNMAGGNGSPIDRTIGEQATVSGGAFNTASGSLASVSGGYFNTASMTYSSVSGGNHNTASGYSSSVSGGYSNTASEIYTSVSGGSQNTASYGYASVSGGGGNTASGEYTSVSGGYGNTANGRTSSVSGGLQNTASGDYSSVSGGLSRSVSGDYDWRAGGYFQDQ